MMFPMLAINPSTFQSTLPRRERRRCESSSPASNNFNPRSREGSDIYTYDRVDSYLHFNPRSREGSDLRLQ